MQRTDTGRSRVITMIGLLLLVAMAIATGIDPLKAQERTQEPSAASKRELVILIEEGAHLPAQTLGRFRGDEREKGVSGTERFLRPEGLQLPNSRASDSEIDVTFTLSGGSANFSGTAGPVATRSAKSSIVSIPPIQAGAVWDESYLSVMVDGEALAENLKVATLPAGSIELLLRYVAIGDPALITVGNNYAVIDESKLAIDTDETISGEVPLTDETTTGEERSREGRAGPLRQAMTTGLCIRPIWQVGGIVKWQISDPKGAGFSYKPEGPNALIWASLPQNLVDGIYNKNWGCYRAFKIPSHCTVNWYSSSYSYCCNLAGILAGKGLPRWVTPGSGAESTWPTCPLR